MKKFVEKTDTHIVFKIEDAKKYLPQEYRADLEVILQLIHNGRLADGKKSSAYYVVKKSEPYAQQVYEAIKEGELEKEESVFDKDPRFCKVCGCSQDHACAGGCYWVTSDLCSNCVYSIFTCEAIVSTDKGSLKSIDGTEDYLADEVISEEISEGFIYGHAAALHLDSETEENALNPGDRIRVYAVYQHGEIIKQTYYVLEPKKE